MIAPWVIGVLLATVASIVSNLGLNLQKLNHTLNEQRIRAQIREERRKAAAAAANASGNTSSSRVAGALDPVGSTTSLASKILSDAQSFHQAGFPSAENSRAALNVAPPGGPASLNAKPAYPSVIPPSQQPQQQLSAAQLANIEAFEKLNSIDYSRQNMWRAGLGLVTLGSILDFVALIFAPQSLIAPLGSLTLVSNTFLAPILLGETVSERDVIATGAIVVGSILAVVFADHGDAMYHVDELFDFLESERFGLYALVIILSLFALHQWKRYLTKLRLTEPRRYSSSSYYVKLHRFSYACASGIMGAQSVLFAKLFGQLLVAWFSGEDIFEFFQTYLIILGLILTIFFQITWLNASLKLFEAMVVVPVFQSFWILVSVTGGMIVFKEYKHVFDDSGSGVFFPLGVLITIAGVYVLSQRGGSGHGRSERESTPRHTPQQRNYMYYAQRKDNLPLGSALSAGYGINILPPTPQQVDDPKLSFDSYQSSPFLSSSDSDSYSDSDLDDGPSGPLLYTTSPAPPIPFMSGPFLDTRFVAPGSAPHSWQESYVLSLAHSPLLLPPSAIPSSIRAHGGYEDPERARLLPPISNSAPPRMGTSTGDSIDVADIVDETAAGRKERKKETGIHKTQLQPPPHSS